MVTKGENKQWQGRPLIHGTHSPNGVSTKVLNITFNGIITAARLIVTAGLIEEVATASEESVSGATAGLSNIALGKRFQGPNGW